MAQRTGTIARRVTKREEPLSRECILEAAITLLDESGEAGFTFRALSDRLATGPGAIYWHIANKDELLTAACDAVIARTMDAIPERIPGKGTGRAPEATIRALALGLFDVVDAHPWLGSVLTSAQGTSPVVRILERVGQGVRALGVPRARQWDAAGTLMAYMLGVSRQNAANGQYARAKGLDRADFLEGVASAWLELDAKEYPFTRSMAERVRGHDDRNDYVAGIDLILVGMRADGTRGRA